MEIARLLYGEHLEMDDWNDLTLEQYALLGILVHPQTMTHRYAKVFDYYSKARKTEALAMIKNRTPIPEIVSLTKEEAAQITKIVNQEFDAMLSAIKNRVSYQDAFVNLFPYISPFPSTLIWIKRKVDGIPAAVSYEYEDFLLRLLSDNPDVREYRPKFAKEIKMYANYLKLVQA